MKYDQVKALILDRIEKRTLTPGQRMPSIRQMSEGSGVSKKVVEKAYQELKVEGHLESQGKKGYFVATPKDNILKPFNFQFVGPKWMKRVAENNGIASHQLASHINRHAPYLMSESYAPKQFQPMQMIGKKIRQATRHLVEETTNVNNSRITEKLKRLIWNQYFSYGCSINEYAIEFTSGALNALRQVLDVIALTEDRIAVESPISAGIYSALEQVGLKTVDISSDPISGIDLKDFRRKVKSRKIKSCIVMPNVNSPTGSILSDDKKRQLVDMADELGVHLIELDLLADLAYDHRPKPLLALDPKNVTLISSYSKSVSDTLRFGYFISEKHYFTLTPRVIYSYGSISPILSATMFDILRSKDFTNHLTSFRKTCHERVAYVRELCTRYFPDEVQLSEPRGGFYLWATMPEGADSAALYREMITKGILFLPGVFASPDGTYSNCFRLNCLVETDETFEKSFQTFGKAVRRMV